VRTYKHNLSHTHAFSGTMGKIIPFMNLECLPNDIMQVQVDGLIRLSPLVAPLMHRLKATIVLAFSPLAMLEPDFGDFITGGVDGNDTTTLDTLSTGTSAKKTVYDYMGVPVVDNLTYLAYPIYSYNRFYNEYIRDPDLEQTEVADNSTDIQYVNWAKDWATTLRPSSQKGTAVTISLGTTAPITGIGMGDQTPSGSASATVYETDQSSGSTYTASWTDDTDAIRFEEDPNNSGFPNIRADLSSATGIAPNDLKEALALQMYMENRYMFGSRFSEYLKFLGGASGDNSIKRPEIISISSADISISEVLQTAPDSGTSTVVGELKGHGIAGIRGNRAFKWFGEHGYLQGYIWIRPESIYTGALHRKWSRTDKEDFFQPELADIGDLSQEVLCREINAQGTGAGTDDTDTFGYGQPYMEYMSEPSRVSADFRDSLDHWHLARQISGKPVLNSAFVSTENNIRESDVFASTTTDTVYFVMRNSVKARRIVPPRKQLAIQRY
jgi:hypothetical protein